MTSHSSHTFVPDVYPQRELPPLFYAQTKQVQAMQPFAPAHQRWDSLLVVLHYDWPYRDTTIRRVPYPPT
jgi:hypothetical protein